MFTSHGAERTNRFHEDYKYLAKGKTYNILTFESLGWPFPFREESALPSFKVPKTAATPVYALSRYTADSCPTMLYIPSRRMLMTMMRACIQVTNINELWISDIGASLYEKTDTTKLKHGSLIMIKGHPCKILDINIAKRKPGTQTAKVTVKGRDILTHKHHDCHFHTGDMVDTPIIKKVEFTLLSIEEDGALLLVDESGEKKEDNVLPELKHLKEVKNNINKWSEEGKYNVVVTVIFTVGKEQVIEAKKGAEIV